VIARLALSGAGARAAARCAVRAFAGGGGAAISGWAPGRGRVGSWRRRHWGGSGGGRGRALERRGGFGFGDGGTARERWERPWVARWACSGRSISGRRSAGRPPGRRWPPARLGVGSACAESRVVGGLRRGSRARMAARVVSPIILVVGVGRRPGGGAAAGARASRGAVGSVLVGGGVVRPGCASSRCRAGCSRAIDEGAQIAWRRGRVSATLEIAAEVGGAAVAAGAIARQRGQHDVRRATGAPRGRTRTAGDVGVQDVLQRLRSDCREERAAGQHLPHHHAQREEVGSPRRSPRPAPARATGRRRGEGRGVPRG
jgi:hypothetical protein